MGKIITIYQNNIDKAWFNSSNVIYSECIDKKDSLKEVNVVFKDGSEYTYFDVAVQDYLMFREDASQGKALNKFIKKYKYVKKESKRDLEQLNNELEETLQKAKEADNREMNNVDKQYLDILNRILTEGTLKHTRAGDTLSIFGAHAEFNLQEGLPLLTTKKVFYKGAIHELIWFLKGDTNIKYLVDNNVNIWTDDAYRWFKTLNFKEYGIKDPSYIEGYYKLDYCVFELDELTAKYEIIAKDDSIGEFTLDELHNLSKERFVELVKQEARVYTKLIFDDRIVSSNRNYRFGDLGPIYGKQWRSFGIENVDQIKNIIDTLKTNPDDRRMLCIAWNPDVLDKIALPACHTMFQFYARELTKQERFTWLQEHGDNKYDEWKDATNEKLDELNVPKRALSLSFYMRSNDFCCGNPYNIAQYGLLVYIIGHLCNMVPEKLIYNGGDVHVYCNHIENAKIQLGRKGSSKLPIVTINPKLESINDIKFEDITIHGYEPDEPIKYQLNVG